MSKKDYTSIKSETDLQKLIEDTRKLRNAVKPVFNPSVYLLINGMEAANFRESGFPKFADIQNLLDHCIPKYRPLEIVVDSSLRYLLQEEEQIIYEKALREGLLVKNVLVPFIEVASYEDTVLTLLKHALDKNAKILSNQDLLESYEIITQRKPKHFENKKFQVNYTITDKEITIIER